jgi:type IV pilus assembly protein PilW
VALKGEVRERGARGRQRGMSLVEILVAMAIGLIGMLVITQAYIATDKFNRSTLGESGAQTNGTVALFTLARDVRMAGYGMSNAAAFGCGKINWYYDPNYSTNLGGTLPDITLAPLYITVTPGQPDQITTMYSTSTRPVPGTLSQTMPAASSELNVDGTTGYAEGDLVVLVNQTGAVSCTMAQISHVQPIAAKLQHNPGIDAPYNPPGAGLFPAYKKDDLVFDLGNPRVRNYSIVNGRLRVTDALATAGGAAPYDMVDGIVDLRAEYGKDNGVNNGTVANTIYAADDGVVDSFSNATPASGIEWQEVLAIRMAVLARIGVYEKPTGGVCTATTVAPTWANGSRSFTLPEGLPSCYRYRVFETVVPLRNLIWRPA